MATLTPGKLIALPVLFLSLLLAWQGAKLVQRDLAFEAARTEVSFWGRGNYQPTEHTIKRTGNTLANLTAKAMHPEYLSVQAAYYSWRAYWEGDTHLATRATQAQYLALESRPANPQDRKKLLEYASRDPNGADVLSRVRPRAPKTPGQ